MAQHLRFVATSYNLWGQNRWPERAGALESYFRLAAPDIICLQELSEPSRDLLDSTLPGHERVDDDFEGWLTQGNIYWSTDLFSLLEYGAVDVGLQSRLRRLFWVRLQPTTSSRTIVVSTIHLTYRGTEPERLQGQSPRIEETRRTIEALDELVKSDEATLVLGDLNESINVIRMFQAAGYVDSFTSCGAPMQPTHPTRPTGSADVPAPRVIDWQFARGPIKAMNSHVGEFFVADTAPSDHKPVVATYGMDAS